MTPLADVHEARAANERLQCHHRFQGRGDNHLKSEIRENVHGQRGEFVVGLIESFVEHYRRVGGRAMLRTSQLIAQGGGETRGGQLLALPARLAGAAAMNST